MMNTGIQINKYIRKWLVECPELTALVDVKNIRPLVLPPSTYPFVSFTHDAIQPIMTKDLTLCDAMNIIIACVDKDYEKTIDIASIIRDRLENKYYKSGDAEGDILIRHIVL